MDDLVSAVALSPAPAIAIAPDMRSPSTGRPKETKASPIRGSRPRTALARRPASRPMAGLSTACARGGEGLAELGELLWLECMRRTQRRQFHQGCFVAGNTRG